MKLAEPPHDLVDAAVQVIQNAYAPYSGFRVASAVRAGSGRIYVGVNVENSSYGLTVCAERVAVFSAITNGEREIREVLVYTADSEEPVFPCGACLQVLSEFGGENTIIHALAGRSGRYSSARLSELLPRAFRFRPARRLP